MTIIKTAVMCLALANVVYFLWAQGVATSNAVVAAPAAPAAAPLKLAAESAIEANTAPTGRAGLDGARGGSLVTVAQPAPVAARCVSVGPFRDVAEAAHAASTLRGGGYDPRQRVTEGEVWAGFWVYVPVPPGRAAREQALARLKAGGIDDAMEMPGPNDGPVVSLGLFSEAKRAQARLVQAQALGLAPVQTERKRTGSVYWIDVDLKPSDAPLEPTVLRADSGHPARMEVAECPVGSRS